MSSWALTSFLKTSEEQPSGLAGIGSIIETENVGVFHNEDMSMDDFSKIGPNNSGKSKRRSKKDDVPLTEKKRKRLSIHTDVIMPQSSIRIGVKGPDVLA